MAKAECKVCLHPKLDAIEVQLTRRVPYRDLARKFRLSIASLSRHKTGGHISSSLVALPETPAPGERSNVQRVESLISQVERVLQSAQKSGKAALSLAAVKELSMLNENLRRLRLDEPVAIDILRNTQWIELRTILMRAFDSAGSEFEAKAKRMLVNAVKAADMVGPGGRPDAPSDQGKPNGAGEARPSTPGPLPI